MASRRLCTKVWQQRLEVEMMTALEQGDPRITQMTRENPTDRSETIRR